MSKNIDKRFPSARNNISQLNQQTESMLGMKSKLGNIDNCMVENDRYDEINENNHHHSNNSQSQIAKRIQLKIKTKKLSGDANRRASQKSYSNGYLTEMQSNTTIGKEKSTIQKDSPKSFMISLESLSHKVEQMWQSSDKINNLVEKYSQKSNKLNILRIKQLIWRDLNMILCEYSKKMGQQQHAKYEHSISSEIILQGIIINRINKVCSREQLYAKCDANQKTVQMMIEKRIKQLEMLKIR